MDKMIKNIDLSKGILEPTDNQGLSLEGYVPFGDFYYNVELGYSSISKEEQALEQIREIDSKDVNTYKVVVLNKNDNSVFFTSRETDNADMAFHLRRCLIGNDFSYGRDKIFIIVKM